MAKKCNIWILEWLSKLLEWDATASALLNKINLWNLNKEIFVDNMWKLIESDSNSLSAYNTLLSYSRFKIIENWIDRNRFIVSLVDRMRKFWYDDIPYGNFWEYINKLEAFDNKQLISAWFSKQWLEKWRDWFAMKLLNDFEYALDVEKTVGKVTDTIKVWEIEKTIGSKELNTKLNEAFSRWSKKFGDDRAAYQKWLKEIFGGFIWANYNITDWVLNDLIKHWASYDVFADIIAYRYITSGKASFYTAFKILNNPDTFKSLKSVDWVGWGDFISEWKDTDSITEKRNKLIQYLYQNKKNKSFNLMWESIRKSMMIDFAWISSNVDIPTFVKNAIWSNLLIGWDKITDAYLRHINWETVVDSLLWNPVDFSQYPPYYYFGIDDDSFKAIFPVEQSLISNFWVDYNIIRNDFINNLIKKNWIKDNKQLVKSLQLNSEKMYDAITKKLNELSSDKNVLWDWLISIAWNVNWQVSTRWKRVVIIWDNEWLDSLAESTRAAAIKGSETNYIPTWIDWTNTEWVVFFNSKDEAKLLEWDVILAQDNWTDLKKYLESNSPANSTIITPAKWLRFNVKDWEVIVSAFDGQYLDIVYSWIWNILNNIRFSWWKKNNTIKQINRFLKRNVDLDNSITQLILEWWTENLREVAIKNYSALSQRTTVVSSPKDILSIASKLIDKKNIEWTKKYISSFFTSDEVASFNWDNITKEDIAFLITSQTSQWITEIGKRLSSSENIYPKIKVTDYDSFWRSFIKREQRYLRIRNVWDTNLYKSFFNVLWNNESIIKVVWDELKKVATNIDIELEKLNSWKIDKLQSIDDMIQNAINSIGIISKEDRTNVINFVNKFLEWNSWDLNRLEYRTRKWTVSNAKISQLWWALEYYWEIISKIKKDWIEIDKSEDLFKDIWKLVSEDIPNTKKQKLILELEKQQDDIIDLMNDKSKRLEQLESDIKQSKTDYENEVSPTREAAKKEIYKALQKEKNKVQKEYDKLIDKKDKILDKIDEADKLPDTVKISKRVDIWELRQYTINWWAIDWMRWVNWKTDKNIKSWLVNSILDKNFEFWEKVKWWVKKFNYSTLSKSSIKDIEKFEMSIKSMKDGIDLQYEIYKLNDSIRNRFNDVAEQYGDLIRFIWEWDNTFSNLFFKDINILVNTPKDSLLNEIKRLKDSVSNNAKRIWLELNQRISSKDIKWTIRNMLLNWYTAVYDNAWFATVRIEDAIQELIDINKLYEPIYKNYDLLKNTKWDDVPFSQKQRIFANLYATHFWRKMAASLDDLSKLIVDKDIWTVTKKLINDYSIVKRDGITMPKAFFNADNKSAALDMSRSSKIFEVISEWYKSQANSVTLSNSIAKSIEDVYKWENIDTIDELKQLYSIYPKLIENDITRKIVLWDKIDWLEKMVWNELESIRSFKTYQWEIQKFAPNVYIDWQNVYNMWFRDTIQMKSFIPRFTTQDKYSKWFSELMDSIKNGRYWDVSKTDLDLWNC